MQKIMYATYIENRVEQFPPVLFWKIREIFVLISKLLSKEKELGNILKPAMFGVVIYDITFDIKK